MQNLKPKKITLKDISEFCLQEKIAINLIQIKKLEKFFNEKIESPKKTLTRQQQKAFHLWLEQVAQAFRDGGIDVKLIEHDVSVPVTATFLKEVYWRRIQKAVTGKQSTTELDRRKEIDLIFDVLNRHFGEKFQIHVPFPSYEELYRQLQENDFKFDESK